MVITYVLLLLCLVTLVLWPYERVVIGRITAVRRIMKICDKRNINFKILNRAYFFSSNKRDKFDFIIRIGKTIIPVKFYSACDKKSTIILMQSGKITVRRKRRELLGNNRDGLYRIVEKTESVPYMRIEKNIIGDKFKCFPIFLNEPPFETIYTVGKNGELCEFYDASGRVAGCNFMDSKTLEELIAIYFEQQ